MKDANWSAQEILLGQCIAAFIQGKWERHKVTGLARSRKMGKRIKLLRIGSGVTIKMDLRMCGFNVTQGIELRTMG